MTDTLSTSYSIPSTSWYSLNNQKLQLLYSDVSYLDYLEYSWLIFLPCISHCCPVSFYQLHYFQDDLVTGKLCLDFGTKERQGLHDLAFASRLITVSAFALPAAPPHTLSLLQPSLQFPPSVHNLFCFSSAFSMKLHLTTSVSNKCLRE